MYPLYLLRGKGLESVAYISGKTELIYPAELQETVERGVPPVESPITAAESAGCSQKEKGQI